jgi:hypothetical protein
MASTVGLPIRPWGSAAETIILSINVGIFMASTVGLPIRPSPMITPPPPPPPGTPTAFGSSAIISIPRDEYAH